MGWNCPFAIELKHFKWNGARTALGCEARKEAGKSYNTQEEEANLICGSQYYCVSCGKMKNTPLAPKCYEAMKRKTDING